MNSMLLAISRNVQIEETCFNVIMMNKFLIGVGRLYNDISDFLSNHVTTLNGILTFLSVSSIWIGVTGFFVTYISYTLLGLAPNITACFIVFLVVFSVYSLNKFTDTDEDEINMPERIRFISHRKNVVLLSALSAYVLSIILTFLVKPSAVPIVFIPLITNAVYGSKLMPWIPRFKDIPVMKNVFVALSWALVVVLLPAVGTIDPLNRIEIIVFYFVLVKCFINTVLFDLRDVNGDLEMGIETMPVILGVRKTLDVLLVINSSLIFLVPFVTGEVKVLMAAMALYGCAIILHFRERRNSVQFDLLVDGEWMLASILYIILYKLSIGVIVAKSASDILASFATPYFIGSFLIHIIKFYNYLLL